MRAPSISFVGRNALVTGGASGIGEETARLLVQLGATVVLADRNAEKLPPAMRRAGAAATVCGDVADEADAERMVAETVAAVGGVDLVVNAAGIGDDLVPVHEQEPSRWRHVVDVNLWGTYLVCRAAGRRMMSAGGG